MKLNTFVVFCLFLLACLLATPARAQPASGGPRPGPTAPTAVPLDGGTSLLLAAGIGLGLRRLRAGRPDAG